MRSDPAGDVALFFSSVHAAVPQESSGHAKIVGRNFFIHDGRGELSSRIHGFLRFDFGSCLSMHRSRCGLIVTV